MLRETFQHGGVQRLFARQRLRLCAEYALFKRAQFFGEVAFGVFQRLPPTVIGGQVGGLGARDFNVKTADAVVFHLQGADAGAGALAGFDFAQQLCGTILQGAKLVEFGVKPIGKHATVAQNGRAIRRDGAGNQFGGFFGYRQIFQQGVQARANRRRAQKRGKLRQFAQGLAQRQQFARARTAQCDAGADALNIGTAAQVGITQFVQHAAGNHRFDDFVARRGARRLGKRMMQGVAQPAAAGSGLADIEAREQRGRSFIAQRLGQFQIAAGGVIQMQKFAFALDGERGDVRQRVALRVLRVFKQCAQRAGGKRAFVQREGVQMLHFKVFAQHPFAMFAFKLPVG